MILNRLLEDSLISFKLLPIGLPVLATTATATKKVEADIAQQMGENLTIIRGNLMRENFKLFVIKVPQNKQTEKLIWLGKNLDKLPGSKYYLYRNPR